MRSLFITWRCLVAGIFITDDAVLRVESDMLVCSLLDPGAIDGAVDTTSDAVGIFTMRMLIRCRWRRVELDNRIHYGLALHIKVVISRRSILGIGDLLV